MYVSVNKQLVSFQNCFGVVFRLLRGRFKRRLLIVRGRNISCGPVLRGSEVRSPGADFVMGCSRIKEDVFANHICDHILHY